VTSKLAITKWPGYGRRRGRTADVDRLGATALDEVAAALPYAAFAGRAGDELYPIAR
jgi:hypothetical protein